MYEDHARKESACTMKATKRPDRTQEEIARARGVTIVIATIAIGIATST